MNEEEKNKKLEEERLTATQIKAIELEAYNKARADFERNYIERSQLYEKVIDMMAKDLVKVPTNDYVSETQQEIIRYMNRHLKEKIETAKQYYFKKARGDEDVKN